MTWWIQTRESTHSSGMRIGLTIAMACLLSGCITDRAIVAQADGHNQTVELIQNRMLLLNILRTSKQQPTYFTALTTVRGDATVVVGTGSIAVPFGGGGDEKYNVNPNASLTIKPSFDMAVLDTQEFHRGFLQPVTPETMGFFLDQGWPRQLVLHLFVREIQFASGERITNTPIGDPEEFAKFQGLMDAWTSPGARIEVTTVEKVECLGPDLSEKDVPNPRELLKLREGGFILKSGPCAAATEAQPKAEDAVFHLAQTKKVSELHVVSRSVADPKAESQPHTLRFIPEPAASTGGPAQNTDIVRLRSPEAMVYYIGELVRSQQLNTGAPVKIAVGPAFACTNLGKNKDARSRAYLFRVDHPIRRGIEYTVTVRFEDGDYGIRSSPWDCKDDAEAEDRSTHVMRLLTQIIGLQKSGDAFPAPQTLRVVN